MIFVDCFVEVTQQAASLLQVLHHRVGIHAGFGDFALEDPQAIHPLMSIKGYIYIYICM
jgi:hypothetical protein